MFYFVDFCEMVLYHSYFLLKGEQYIVLRHQQQIQIHGVGFSKP